MSHTAYIFGSHRVSDAVRVSAALERLLAPEMITDYHLRHGLRPPDPIERVWHGSAPGAETLAARWAEAYGYDVRNHPVTLADRQRHGIGAAAARNARVVAALPRNSLCIGFADPDATCPGDLGGGVLHNLILCRDAGHRCRVVWSTGRFVAVTARMTAVALDNNAVALQNPPTNVVLQKNNMVRDTSHAAFLTTLGGG